MLRFLFVLFMCFSAAAKAAEGFMDGNALLRLLSAQNTQDRMTGVAYVMGVADAIDRQRTQYNQCFALPEKVTSTQLADVVKLFLEKNPAGRHFKGADLAASALEEAFPCRAKP